MKEFTTENGAKVMINPASWQNAMKLKNAIFKELSASGFKLDLEGFGSGKLQVSDSDIDVSKIIQAVLQLDSSYTVNAALAECLQVCTYKNERITDAIFDNDMKAREDYYTIVAACLTENLTPFFKGLLSKFSGMGKLAELFTQK